MAYKDFLIDLKARSGSNLVPDGKFNFSSLRRFPLNAQQNCGYSTPPRDSRHKLFTFAGTWNPDYTMFQAITGQDVDPRIWEWVPVIYPHGFPVNASVATGVNNCIEAINAWPGKFGLSGYSQGAIVCSSVLWELRNGSLQNRYNDLIGAVMFGNPKRELGVTFPGGIDPGGAGMAPDTGDASGRIRNTPTFWWEFANSHLIPGSVGEDPFAVNPQTPGGVNITAIYQLMLGEFSGDEYELYARLQELFSPQYLETIQSVIQSLIHVTKGLFLGHMEYAWSRPLPGSMLSSVDLGIQHLNSVGDANPLTPQLTGGNPNARAWFWDHVNGSVCGFTMAPTDRIEYFDVVSGDIYLMEANVMPYGANTITNGSVQIGATFTDTRGNLSSTEIYADYPQNGLDMIRGKWNAVKTSITIPAGYNRAVFWIRTTANTHNSNKFWIDDVVLRENTTASIIIDNITNAFTGDGKISDSPIADALNAIRNDVKNNSKAIQALLAGKNSFAVKGKSFVVDFSNFSSMTQAGFTVSYTGPGTSTIGISGGAAQWLLTTNADRDAKIIYDTPTATNSQIIRGTLSTPPQSGGDSGKPKFSALLRVSEDGMDYVFARAYANSLVSYRGELGCVVNGVETVWQSNIPLTWSLDMTVVAGVGTDERQYQVWSGNTLVTTYTESLVNTSAQNGAPTGGNYRSICGNTWKIHTNGATGGTFTLTYKGSTTAAINWNDSAATVQTRLNNLNKGTWTVAGIGSATSAGGPWYLHPPVENAVNDALTSTSTLTGGTGLTVVRDEHRKWGSIAQIRAGSGGPFHSGKVAGCSTADNQTPTIIGSAARMVRTASSGVTFTGGSSNTGLANNFFDVVSYESPDIDANIVDGTFTVTISQPYVISGRVRLNANIVALCRLGLQIRDGNSWNLLQAGDTFYPSSGGAGQNISGTWVQYLNAGDVIRLSTWTNAPLGTSTLAGESSGTETYFSIAGQGGSD